jgi:hypothetical protein
METLRTWGQGFRLASDGPCGPRTAMKQRWDRRFRLSRCGVGASACPLGFNGAAGLPPGAEFRVSLTFANSRRFTRRF